MYTISYQYSYTISLISFHAIREMGSRTVQSAAIFGAVGGVLGAVVSVAVVLIVVVTAVMIVIKKRKPNAIKQGTNHAYKSTDSRR